MQSNKGLSFIELIIFIVIMGLAIPPLLIVAANTYNQSINMETIHIATNLTSQKMEDVISQDYNLITDEPTSNFTGQFNDYQYQVDVDYVALGDLDTSVDPTPTDCKRVTVTVQEPRLGSRTVTFRMIVCDD